MTENAMAFALNNDFFCKFADDSIILNFDTDSLSWTNAVNTILSTFSDDIASYMQRTGASIADVKSNLEEKLIEAAENLNDQPALFPF